MFTPLRIVFAGTSNFSAFHLYGLLSTGYQIIGVFTKPDRPIGRGHKITPTPVKVLAEIKGIPVFQPLSLQEEEIHNFITKLNVDIIIVVSYGMILPKSVLEIPRLGCINVHASLLPRWRGAAPIQRAILAGDTETGITIIQMNVNLDCGDILYKISCQISTDDTSLTLCNKLARLGTKGLIKILDELTKGSINPKKQDSNRATYAKKINKNEALVDWLLSANQLKRCIQAFNPWPISRIKINGESIKIWKASVISSNILEKPGTIIEVNRHGIQVSTSRDILNLELLQLPGKKVMKSIDILNSHQQWFVPGSCLI